MLRTYNYCRVTKTKNWKLRELMGTALPLKKNKDKQIVYVVFGILLSSLTIIKKIR